MQNMFEKLLILRTPGIGPIKYNELVNKFGSVSAAVQSLNPSAEFKDSILAEMEQAEKLNIHYISDDDELYPNTLREIRNHPIILTARGNLDTLKKQSISIVGTRHATGAGLRFISDLAQAFAEHGHVIVSGMAMGTDTAAHVGALRAPGNAQTIAVLAGGADYVWPLENESLYFDIMERGCIISEMPVGFVPMGSNFVQRNRGIAALSQRLFLGEADLKSGSMHTARFAIEYKKEVFAIPSHPSDARSLGPNSLIKAGTAKILCSIGDFFDEENHSKQENKTAQNALFDILGMIPLSESVLAELVKKSVMEIKRDLVVLELQGKARKVDGGYVKI